MEKGAKSIDDLKRIEVTASSTARNAPTSIYPRMLNALYGTKIKVVEGYPGSQESLLAMERNEVDSHVSGGSSAAFRARIAPLLKSDAKIILQMGMARDPVSRHPDRHRDHADRRGQATVRDRLRRAGHGTAFVLPPGVPADRVKVLRDAFDAAVKDPELLEDAKSQRMEIDPVTGADINALLDRVYAAPPEIAARLREMAK